VEKDRDSGAAALKRRQQRRNGDEGKSDCVVSIFEYHLKPNRPAEEDGKVETLKITGGRLSRKTDQMLFNRSKQKG
jgi:hypothetical protein